MRSVIFVLLQQQEQLDPLELALNASFVVKMVLILLILMSLVSWFIIGAKLLRLLKATRQSAQFLDVFWAKEHGHTWNAERLEGIYARARLVQNAPIARVFHAGYVELARVTGTAEQGHAGTTQPGRPAPHGGQLMGDLENVERALRRASVNELTSLETAVPFLATTGSTAPF